MRLASFLGPSTEVNFGPLVAVRWTAQWDGLRSAHGISGSKLAIPGWLFRGGTPMTATDLARLERLQPQSLTLIKAELDKRELIRRTPAEEDRRQVPIEVTQAGKRGAGGGCVPAKPVADGNHGGQSDQSGARNACDRADLLDKLASESAELNQLSNCDATE